ncbi:MAG: hypothetical protein ACI4A8_00425 [Muribaculaceae bacterium]
MMITLREAISASAVDARAVALLQCGLVDAMTDSGVVPTIDNVLLDVASRQVQLADAAPLPAADECAMVKGYGEVLMAAVGAMKYRSDRLVKIALDCVSGEIATIAQLQLVLERRRSAMLFVPMVLLIMALLAILAFFS